MGIYTDAEIRFGIVLPEEVEPEKVENAVNDEDALEVISFGEYDWPSDIPTFALVVAAEKVRCGEMAVQKFTTEEVEAVAPSREVEEIAKQFAAEEFGGDWGADAGYLLVWSRG